jgi:hypothetical protein
MSERKILYSPNFGAGWVTWNTELPAEAQQFMLTYAPIVEAVERGESITPDGHWSVDDGGKQAFNDDGIHPLLAQLGEELHSRFGVTSACFLGADGLRVATVSGPVRLNEYDGSESFEEQGEFQGWL